jgi:hypothetical protein
MIDPQPVRWDGDVLRVDPGQQLLTGDRDARVSV